MRLISALNLPSYPHRQDNLGTVINQRILREKDEHTKGRIEITKAKKSLE
jgi:hypothetical protein